MKSAIRIVKRAKAESSETSRPQDNKQKIAPTEREITSTIKSWIADREQRKRLTERTNMELLAKFAQ